MARFIDRFLEIMLDKSGSDLILTAGAPATLRVDGSLRSIGEELLTPVLMNRIIEELATRDQMDHLRGERELDFAFGWMDRGRFRVNAFYQRGSIGLVLRLIPYKVPTMTELGLPPILQKFADLPRGLVLVTGPTGSGKSTTLAAMLNHINQTRGCHIVTIEDPIEYLHKHQKSIIEQRELGLDTRSFAGALRSVLRENPDVVLLGEMRDLDTISVAVTVAETGHLVFGTLHTNDAPQTVDRVIDMFPANQQHQIRTQFAATIQGVVSQILLPRVGGGRVAAFEIMMVTSAVRVQIREGATHQLRNTMITGYKEGTQTMERALVELYRKGLIREADMLEASLNPGELKSLLGSLRSDANTNAAATGVPLWRR